MNEICILKSGSCPSLSGQSTLSYHIGHKDDGVYLRLVENSQAGIFSDEWLPLQEVENLLASKEYSVKSSSIHTLFMRRSLNNGGFMLAVLINEGLVLVTEERENRYRRCDPTAFTAAIQELLETDTKKESL